LHIHRRCGARRCGGAGECRRHGIDTQKHHGVKADAVLGEPLDDVLDEV
jgi:hypothetical protein